MEHEKVSERSQKHRTGRDFTGLGIFLLLISVVAAIVLGLTVARFAVYDMELKTSECRVLSTGVASERMNCSCTNTVPSFMSSKSSYPCLLIEVALYANGEEHTAYLYENSYKEKNKVRSENTTGFHEMFFVSGNVCIRNNTLIWKDHAKVANRISHQLSVLMTLFHFIFE